MNYLQIGGLILIFVIMYLLMIRPQRKRQKQLDELRKNLSVGDKIVTIGGVRGTIIRVFDDEVMIAVGPDKVKIELKRWAVSTVDQSAEKKAEKSSGTSSKSMADREKELQDEASAPARKPKKLGKQASEATEAAEETVEAASEADNASEQTEESNKE